MNDLQKQIQKLKNHIKQLQNQICQRTRNYLLQKGMQRKPFVKNQDIAIQTDIQQGEYQNKVEYSCGSTIRSQLLKSNETPSNFKKFNDSNIQNTVSGFDLNKSDLKGENQYKKKIAKQMQNLRQQQRRVDEEGISESGSITENGWEESDRKKMRKEIRRLKKHLQYEQKINEYAKQGLMISQQENYQFRLQIKSLMEIVKNPMILNNQQMNRDRVEKLEELVVTLKEQINQIQLKKNQQIKKLNLKIDDLENQIPASNERHQNQNLTDKQLIECLKDKIQEICNVLPVNENEQSINLFRPDTQQEIIQSLQRINQFCSNIDRWQRHSLKQIQQDKKIFNKFLEQLLMKLPQPSIQIVRQQIILNEDMQNYVCLVDRSFKLVENKK